MKRPPPGVYEAPVTRSLQRALDALDPLLVRERALEAPDSAEQLGRVVGAHVTRALRALRGDSAVAEQIALTNDLINFVSTRSPQTTLPDDDLLALTHQVLWAVLEEKTALGTLVEPERPRIPLSSTDLLVNAHHDASVGAELARELASADRVDLLCSFLKWSGLRVIRDAVANLLARRPGGLRVLTTTYMGATERRALDELVRLGAQVRVSYDRTRTRLHAKAWMLHRESGFTTAFVGSSNLSAAAMLDGLEWNVRLSATENGAVVRKFGATFEQYWADPEFEPYDPETSAQKFDDVVAADRKRDGAFLTSIRVRPLPHQALMLEELAAERARGFTKNLVVAATGTGKTVVAALDFERLQREHGKLSLLFVAHRREILEQSRGAFRQTLQDAGFGELLVDGHRPSDQRAVFASIQSLRADVLNDVAADAFDVVIVDEFHHAAANTYRALLEHVRPKFLLGLTATPERADGQSILSYFGDRTATELRLWRALDEGLLSPFQYFGVDDGTPLDHVQWTRTGYDTTALSKVYTGNHARAKRIIEAVGRYVLSPTTMRALAFCVDVDHAEFMAARFVEHGIQAVAVSSGTPKNERSAALSALRDGSVQAVCAVDLFNEGVDVPDIDTVLFLRPTESATVFLQQLGRGLRRSPNKACLTVLDFIGRANARFRFGTRFAAIVGGTRRDIEKQVVAGFPYLPAGCSIQLERTAQETVLDNIRAALGHGRKALMEDLRALPPEQRTVHGLLSAAEIDLETLYDGSSLTELLVRSGVDGTALNDDEQRMVRALRRMLHIDDPQRLATIAQFIEAPFPPKADDALEAHRAMHVLLGAAPLPLSEMASVFSSLWSSTRVMTELRDLMALLSARSRSATIPLTGALSSSSLATHAAYL